MFFLWAAFYVFAKLVKPTAWSRSCSAQLLNSLSRIVLMRRMPFLCSIAVVLLALSFAACGGYSGSGTVNGGGPSPLHQHAAGESNCDRRANRDVQCCGRGTLPLTYQWQKNGADITALHLSATRLRSRPPPTAANCSRYGEQRCGQRDKQFATTQPLIPAQPLQALT